MCITDDVQEKWIRPKLNPEDEARDSILKVLFRSFYNGLYLSSSTFVVAIAEEEKVLLLESRLTKKLFHFQLTHRYVYLRLTPFFFRELCTVESHKGEEKPAVWLPALFASAQIDPCGIPEAQPNPPRASVLQNGHRIRVHVH